MTAATRRLADLPDYTAVVEEVTFVTRTVQITHQRRGWMSGTVAVDGELLPFEVFPVDYGRHAGRLADGGVLLVSGMVDRRSGEPVLRITDVLT